MVKIDGREYHNVSMKYDAENHYTILVTYTVDGEPSAPLYTKHSEINHPDVVRFISDYESGTVQNIRYWAPIN